MPLIVVSFKALQSERETWREASFREHITLSAWIRKTLNNGLGLPTMPAEQKKFKKAAGCEHRLPIGAWCKSCRVIRK